MPPKPAAKGAASTGKKAVAPGDDEQIEFSVKSQLTGKAMRFKLKRSVLFKKCFEYINKRFGIDATKMRFLLEDRVIEPEQSIAENGIAADDTVEFVMAQDGGGSDAAMA